jgi:CubicO group peptidase (beta-lactamase class C family)
MPPPTDARGLLSRRRFLHATAASVLTVATVAARRTPARAATTGPARGPALAAGPAPPMADPDFRELDAKIRAGMARYGVPGVAVGVLAWGREYVQGYGVTNVDYPVPVDGDTLFRIASTTKTFTGTVVMRLVEQGKLDLDAPVRRYLPDLRLADESVAGRVTVRQLLNHSAGWLGDDEQDFGRGDDALANYVTDLSRLPQLTPPGTQFAYNNVALDVAGRAIEVVTGKPYEEAVRALLLEPLGLKHSGFFTDQLAGYPIAGCHVVVGDRPVFEPGAWYLPRNGHPDGGLISSARDQLRYARFHLGDGGAPDGTPLLTAASLAAMRSDPGPGGTLLSEIDGAGVSFFLRRTAEGVHVVQHGGDWTGQISGFVFVPERDFAMTLLTNSEGGGRLRADLFLDDWALQRFAGLRNPPAVPSPVPPARLAEYEGTYVGFTLMPPGEYVATTITLQGSGGVLRGRLEKAGAGIDVTVAFYRDEYVVFERAGSTAAPGSERANFVRGSDGRVAWLSYGGRLYRHEA